MQGFEKGRHARREGRILSRKMAQGGSVLFMVRAGRTIKGTMNFYSNCASLKSSNLCDVDLVPFRLERTPTKAAPLGEGSLHPMGALSTVGPSVAHFKNQSISDVRRPAYRVSTGSILMAAPLTLDRSPSYL